MQPSLRMIIDNEPTALTHLMAVARAYLAPFDLDNKSLFAVELILEEVVTNVIHHGFEEAGGHLIAVNLSLEADKVHLQVADEGRAFNPLSAPRLDVQQPLMERLEGGLGIHLVRQMMNSMAYRRESDRNIFEIWIRDRGGKAGDGGGHP